MVTSLLLVLSSGLTLAQQPLLDSLADDICACMQAAPEIVYPRIQAQRCLEQIARRRTIQLREVLDLSSKDGNDRQELVKLLIDPLTERCPLLHTLKEGAVEPELHYSDFALAKRKDLAVTTKSPVADPPSTTLREGDEVITVSGELLAIPDKGSLRIRTSSGETLTLYYRTRQLRGQDLTIGQTLTITYRHDWQQSPVEVQRWIAYFP